MGVFKKNENTVENLSENIGNVECPSCKVLLSKKLEESLGVCPNCGHHFSLGARERIAITADIDSFCEMFGGVKSVNILNFPEYDEKLEAAQKKSGEDESVICGRCKIFGQDTCLFVMDGNFMMGSMGSVTGEKITKLFEYATENSLPVVGFCVSGGARMQEGIISLMQMAKISGAVGRHGEGGNLYVSILTNPTSGGVTASFAMQADIIIAEPKALICFAGPRVIEQTIKQSLPSDFQKAEFLFEKGFLDDICERRKMKEYLYKLLQLHGRTL